LRVSLSFYKNDFNRFIDKKSGCSFVIRLNTMDHNHEVNKSEFPPIATQNRLQLPTLIGLVVANMIGAGVFTTSGFALADLGSSNRVIVAWFLGGIIALCGALSYGGLVRHFTESGGEYLFLSRALHPLAGFIAGWVSLLAGFTGAIAFAALAFETYVSPIMPFNLPPKVLAIGLIVVAALLHGARVRAGIGVQNAVVFLKLILILIFIVGAVFSAQLFSVGFAAPPAPEFSLTVFAGSLVWISLSYSGFNAAVYVAGEARNAQTVVPRAMWIGTLTVTILYLILNSIFVYLAPFEAIVGREDVAATAAQSIGGQSLALLVRIIIIVSLLTSVFAMIMIGPRVYAKMAEDKIFPALFRFHGDVPRAAIAFQATAAILVVAFSTLKNLLSYLGFTLSLSAALTVFCLFLIPKSESKSNKILGYPFTPALFVGAAVLLANLAAWRNPVELIATFLTVLSGIMLYFILNRRIKQRSL
jgi:APA family basic amino acid/polyamine antiporter